MVAAHDILSAEIAIAFDERTADLVNDHEKGRFSMTFTDLLEPLDLD